VQPYSLYWVVLAPADLRLCSPSFASGERGLFRFASRIAPREYAVCFASLKQTNLQVKVRSCAQED